MEPQQTDTTNPATPTVTTALEPTILAIFGISGDLAGRYLLPSLYHLIKQGMLHEKTEIIGISRHHVEAEELLGSLRQLIELKEGSCDEAALEQMRQRCHIHVMDTSDAAAYRALRQQLDDIEAGHGTCMNRLYYLAIPPSAYTTIINHMGNAGLNASCQHGRAQTRLLAEKPFGHDLASAELLIKATDKIFSEDQIYRIDHYLAKETAQNILSFRFQNPLFEHVWDNRMINGIDIVASEQISIEGRTEFYEQQGALRDIIQNHLLQLLAVVAMEKPRTMTSQDIHQAKLAVLQAVRPIGSNEIGQRTARGQYVGYRQSVGNQDSFVETYAFIETEIETPRWQGVPVTVRTGKALAEKHTAITISFTNRDDGSMNNLRFRIQPNEGIQIGLQAKRPGYDQELQPVRMDFSYHQNFDGYEPSAYERVLVDAVRGDQTLFASDQEVLAAWRIVDNVVNAWTANGDGLFEYPSGTAIDDLSDTVSERSL